MYSLNGYSLGSVGEWLFRRVAGIEVDSENTGFQPFVLGRYIAASLTHARAANRTLHAKILRPWRLTGDQLVSTIGVPADCPAGVVVPHAPGTPRFAAGLTPRAQDALLRLRRSPALHASQHVSTLTVSSPTMRHDKFNRWFCLFALAFIHTSLVRAESWSSLVAGRALELKVLEPDATRPGVALPVVFYLRNLASPRVGTESDEILIRELRAAGHLVAMIDYAGCAQARVPFLNRDLAKLRDDVRAKTVLMGRAVDDAHVFIVPAGSRLVRDVVFYRDGERTLAMDIIAPAKPVRPVGAIIEFSCDNQHRMGNNSLSICSDTTLDGSATEGFAVAMADHPVAPPYRGLDAMPDSAWKIKAAVRTLRAQSHALGLNGRIVSVGFSRGSGMALMLATTLDFSEFEGRGEHVASGLSSAVQGAVVMSGRFSYLDLTTDDPMLPRYTKAWGERGIFKETWRRHGALDFLTKPIVPLFLTINITESPEALHQMGVLRTRLAGLNSPATYALDHEPRGHKVTLDPAILTAMNVYFRQRLNPTSTAPSP